MESVENVRIAVLGAVVELGVHQHAEVRLEAKRPAHRVCDHEDLDGPARVQVGHGALLLAREAVVEEADPVGHGVQQRAVLDDPQEGGDFAADEVRLVNDEQRDVLHILALLPTAGDHIPALRRGDNQLAALEHLEVGGGLAAE